MRVAHYGLHGRIYDMEREEALGEIDSQDHRKFGEA